MPKYACHSDATLSGHSSFGNSCQSFPVSWCLCCSQNHNSIAEIPLCTVDWSLARALHPSVSRSNAAEDLGQSKSYTLLVFLNVNVQCLSFGFHCCPQSSLDQVAQPSVGCQLCWKWSLLLTDPLEASLLASGSILYMISCSRSFSWYLTTPAS